MRAIRLYCPSGLDHTTLQYGEEILWLVTRIIWGRLSDRRLESGFVPVSRREMESAISIRKVTPAIREAIEAGIIERDRHYIPGEKAIGYRLGPEYRGQPVVSFEPSQKVRGSVRAWTEPRKSRGIVRLLWKDLKRLEILPVSDDYLRELAHQSEEWEDAFACHRMAVDLISDGRFRISRDDYGRVHTNVTNLKSELRSFLRIDGHTLSGFDISNSQPLFLAMLLSNPSKVEVERIFSSLPSHDVYALSLMNCTDLDAYRELAASGRLYEFIQSELGGRHSRENIKTECMKFFYGWKDTRSIVGPVFREHFPSVLNAINLIKASNYRTLSHLLQRLEARFVIDSVCGRLKTETGIPLITIHDSILTTDENEEILKDVMFAEFAKFGVQPKLKRQPEIDSDQPHEFLHEWKPETGAVTHVAA